MAIEQPNSNASSEMGFWRTAISATGIGGVVTFILYKLFSQVLDLSLLTKQNEVQTFTIILLVITFTFITAIVGLVLWHNSTKKTPNNSTPTPQIVINFNIPDNATFKGTVEALAKIKNTLVIFTDFEEEELATKLKPQTLTVESLQRCIELLSKLPIKGASLPPYVVIATDGQIELKKI